MNLEDVNSELEALEAIYCGPNEFEIHQKYTGSSDHCDTIFTIRLKSEDGQNLLSVTYTLGRDYPNVYPGISVTSNGLKREACSQLKKDAIEYANKNSLISQPMIMDVSMWLQQEMSTYFDSCETCVSESTPSHERNEELWQALFHLDHMRSRTKYVKIIEKWTSELELTGHLIFSDRLILILLHGSQQNIKEYLKLQKTVNVDVDSKGRSCKERMLSVLSQEPIGKQSHRFTDFEVIEVEPKSLKDLFNEWSLAQVFERYVTGLLQR